MILRKMIAIAVVVLVGLCTPVLAVEGLSEPKSAANASLRLFQAVDIEGFLRLYHPETEYTKMFDKIKAVSQVQYQMTVDYIAELVGFIMEKLQLSFETGEPEMQEDLARVPFTLSSTVVPEFSYDGVMTLKLGPAPGGDGTAWLVWQDGLQEFYAAASQGNAEIVAFADGRQNDFDSRIAAQAEAEEVEKLAKAAESPANCANIYMESMSLTNSHFSSKLLHPDSAARTEMKRLETLGQDAANAYLYFVNRLCRAVFRSLELRFEIGETAVEEDTARTGVTLHRAASPDASCSFTIEFKKDPEGRWCVWNEEAVLEAFERAAKADETVHATVLEERRRFEAALGGGNTDTGGLSARSPEEAVTSLLEALSRGDMGAAETLYHVESGHARQFAVLMDKGRAAPNALNKLMQSAGNLYKEMFKTLQLSWEITSPGENADQEAPLEVPVRLKSALKPDWLSEVPVIVRKGEGEVMWGIWESNLLEPLTAATDGDENLQTLLQNLKGAVKAAEKELDEAASKPPSEAGTDTGAAEESTLDKEPGGEDR